ncbi:hypothetical protein J2W25_002000 [Variovorax boronicumulans]|uniref:Uncharacterized protein n=1 Tax=Variovorax boronicumulans TaxID=436515 RepID=A0AAW8DUG0_9BURK|nr:hypothetical protein [Variovorax boronicumulans]MDP9877695.1 hypothetical protein [Variovorax boronicumulans]MDP9922979.1 hypothetical protein [Variovorax boronicumulans]
MARWSSSIDDILKIRLVARQIPLDGIARIVLLDDTAIEGVIREVNVGNSGGHGGWQYYGECQIETRKKHLRTVDYLDVRSASSIWSRETAAEYERLGLLVNVQRI